MPLVHHAARTSLGPNKETLRLRKACDYLWINEYQRAIRKLMWKAQIGSNWCKVKLPFSTDQEMEWWYELVLDYATALLWERRPGGQSGPAYDLVFFERTPGTIGITGQMAYSANHILLRTVMP